MDSLFPRNLVFSSKKVVHQISITPDSFLSLETNILFPCLKHLSKEFQLGWRANLLHQILSHWPKIIDYVVIHTLLQMRKT